MENLNSRALKNHAVRQLSRAAYDPKRLALIHAGISLGVGLVLTLIDLLLAQQIENTQVGLSGMGSRTIFQTVQMSLQYIWIILLPFWEIGFFHGALRLVRGEPAEPKCLTEGFRRFGPVLRMYILKFFLFAGIAFACAYVSLLFLSMVQNAKPFMELMQAVQDGTMTIEQFQEAVYRVQEERMEQLMMPWLISFGILYIGAVLPLFYRFRMAEFAVMDEPGIRARKALGISGRMMRRNGFKLFKVDLSFWWFYGILVLAVVVGNLDRLLPALGMTLPVPHEAAWIICYALQLLIQLVLYWRWGSYMQTTYASAYEALRQKKPEPPKPAQTPSLKNTPWENMDTQV